MVTMNDFSEWSNTVSTIERRQVIDEEIHAVHAVIRRLK